MPLIINNVNNNDFFTGFGEIVEGVREGTARSLDGNADHVRMFKVIVKQQEMTDTAVCLCPGLPLLGSIYLPMRGNGDPEEVPFKVGVAWDSLAMCYRLSAKQQDRDDWHVWVVTAVYTRNIPFGQATSADPEKAFNDPTAEGVDLHWDWETVQEARQLDIYGMPYLNMANQPFSPPKTRPVRYPVLVLRRNEAGPSAVSMVGSPNLRNAQLFQNQLQKYSDSLNDYDFLGAPRGCVQLDGPPKAEVRNRGFLVYWNVTYRFKFRPLQGDGGYVLPPLNVLLETIDPVTFQVYWQAFPNKADLVDSWQPLLLNEGMYRLGTKDPAKGLDDLDKLIGRPIPIMKWGQQVHHPVLLDQFGQECKPSNVPNLAATPSPGGGLLVNNTITNRIQPWWMRFGDFPYRDFTALINNGL